MVITVVVRKDGALLRQGRVTCGSSFEGRRLKVLSHRLDAGKATCSWRLPPATRGKVVTGTVVVRQGRLSAEAPFRARIT